MKKRLSKPLWYGIGVDSDGNPIVPKPATSPDDLEGLHEGELFLHLKEGIVTLWSLSADGAVVEISGGGGVDLSQYLLKSVWDKVWEIKTDPQGNEYIFGKLPLVTQYGITMYADDSELDLPSIYAGLPIDNQTLYWENGVLKAKGGTEGAITSITSTMIVDALGYIPANGSDVTALQNKVNDFLSGSDTDTIINKWKELESFLSGLSESDNLATILGNKANKATTLEGYGITDAYTKNKVDEMLGNYVTVATAQTITGEKNFTGGLKVNGSPIVYDTTNRYWKLEGDLLVTGGITMYASDSGFKPSTVMDAIAVDGTTISKANGYLEVIGGTGGLTEVYWADVKDKPTFASVAISGKYSDLSGVPTLLSSFTDDVVAGKYLPLTGGTLSGALTVARILDITPNELNFSGMNFFLKDGTSFHISNRGGESVAANRNLRIYYFNGTEHTALVDIKPSGFVGIGTTNPRNKLEVAINSNHVARFKSSDKAESSIVYENKDGLVWITGLGAGASGDTFGIYSVTKAANALTCYANGEVWVAGGITMPRSSDGSNMFYIGREDSASVNMRIQNASNGGAIRFNLSKGDGTSPTYLELKRNATILYDGMQIHGTAYIGQFINGTATIDAKYGNAYFGCDALKDGEVVSTVGAYISINGSSGNVGIGKSPATNYKLDVKGTASMTETVVNGASHILRIGAVSYGWGGTNSYPLIYSNDLAGSAYSFLAFPHVPFLQNGSRGYTGQSFGARMRFEGGINTTTILWDVGCPDGDSFWIRRNDENIFSISNDGLSTFYTPNAWLSPSAIVIGRKSSDIHSNYANIGVTNGNLHVDAYNNFSLYLNYYQSNRVGEGVVVSAKGYLGVGVAPNKYQFEVAGSSLINKTYIGLSAIGLNRNTDVGGRFTSAYNGWQFHVDNSTSNLCAYTEGTNSGMKMTLSHTGNMELLGTSGKLTCKGATINGALNVSGTLNVSDAVTFNNSLRLQPAGAYYGSYLYFGDGSYCYIAESTDDAMTIYASKGVTINTDLLVSGGITMYSDIRKKTKLADVELTLKQIAEAPLIKHYYNNDVTRTTHVGSIAQYWAKINDWFCSEDSDGYYTMEVQNAALASAISIARELVKYESETDKKIRLLEDEVERLKEEIRVLKTA